MTEEQRGRWPILIATLRAARPLTGCFVARPGNSTKRCEVSSSRRAKARPGETSFFPARLLESRKGLSEKRLEINRAVARNLITKGGRYEISPADARCLNQTTKIK